MLLVECCMPPVGWHAVLCMPPVGWHAVQLGKPEVECPPRLHEVPHHRLATCRRTKEASCCADHYAFTTPSPCIYHPIKDPCVDVNCCQNASVHKQANSARQPHTSAHTHIHRDTQPHTHTHNTHTYTQTRTRSHQRQHTNTHTARQLHTISTIPPSLNKATSHKHPPPDSNVCSKSAHSSACLMFLH